MHKIVKSARNRKEIESRTAVPCGREKSIQKAELQRSQHHRHDCCGYIRQGARKALFNIPGIRSSVFTQQGLGGIGGRGRPVDFVIQGPTYEELTEWRDIVIRKAEGSGLMLNVTSDYNANRPELRVTVDRDGPPP